MKAPKGVPRDEWLLAVGLANFKDAEGDFGDVLSWPAIIADAVERFGACSNVGSDCSAAYSGAHAVIIGREYSDGRHLPADEGNADAYAAGAALAMHLQAWWQP